MTDYACENIHYLYVNSVLPADCKQIQLPRNDLVFGARSRVNFKKRSLLYKGCHFQVDSWKILLTRKSLHSTSALQAFVLERLLSGRLSNPDQWNYPPCTKGCMFLLSSKSFVRIIIAHVLFMLCYMKMVFILCFFYAFYTLLWARLPAAAPNRRSVQERNQDFVRGKR